jgi:hypothetical protein
MPSQVFRIIAWLSVVIATIVSLQPVRPRIVAAHHGLAHVLAFALIMFLFCLRFPNRRYQFVTGFAIFLWGFSLECLQHLIYRHSIEWHDVFSNALGVLVALLFCDLILRMRALFCSDN